MTDGGSTTEGDDEDQRRKRGILSQSDRRYLRLSEDEREDEYSRPLRYERRQRIKERTGNAALDIPVLVQYADDEVYEYAFGTQGTSEGMIGAADTARIRRTFPKFIVFLLRAVLVEEPTRPIETTDDLRAVIRPFLDEVESGIEHWLNQERDVTADFEIKTSVDKLQTIAGFIEELEKRRTPVTGRERIQTVGILERAGVDRDEIVSLLGEDAPEEVKRYKDYSTEELAELSNKKLSRLLADGVLSVAQHSAAIDAKIERGKN
jgi:hypothetical protein